MSDERWSVLGLAPPRAQWFAAVGRWATEGTVPVDFVRCVSVEEVLARLAGGRRFSALLVGADTPGFGIDLEAAAERADVPLLVAGPEHRAADVDLVVPFEPDTLVAALAERARPVPRVDTLHEPAEVAAPWRGRLVAVTGPAGQGRSVLTIALAQHLASAPAARGLVALADLALHADQAMLHGAGDIIPGLPELVDGHGRRRMPTEDIRALTHDVDVRGYHLLLGLRRHRDWTSLRPRAFDAAIDGLCGAYRLVVADVDADVEGATDTGSVDVEERNLMARGVLRRADVVVVVGTASMTGIHTLGRTVRDLAAFEVDPERMVTVLNRAPRSRRRRAAATRALAALTAPVDGLDNPVIVGERTDVEDALRDGVRVPAALGWPAHRAVAAVLDRLPTPGEPQPVAVGIGVVGTWTDEGEFA